MNGGKLNFEIFIEDLLKDKLTARSALWVCAKDHTVRVAVMVFFAIFSYHNVVSEYPSRKIIKKSNLDLTLST